MQEVSRARSSMTEFQLPSNALVPAVPSGIRPEEVRDGLMYEVQLVMQGIHFLLVSLILVSVLVPWADTVTASSILVYLSWYLLQSGWGRGNRKSRKILLSLLRPTFWLNGIFVIILLFTNYRSSRFEQFLIFNSVTNTIWSLNFHPYFQVLIQAPLQDVQVRTGIVALGLMYLVRSRIRYDYTDPGGDPAILTALLPLTGFAIVTRAILFIIFVFAALLTTGFAVRAGFRAADVPRSYKIYAPWVDLPMAIKSLLEFRSFTNMKMSAFIRLLDAHTDGPLDESDVDVETLVEWMGEERGVGTWKFLTWWKPKRLGKSVMDTDMVVPTAILDSLQIKAVLNSDAPLRSPLLRGHV